MARRSGFRWAMGGSAVLALLLVLACHSGSPLADGAGMSAPPVRPAAVESARAAQLLPSRSDWHGAPPAGVAYDFALIVSGTVTPGPSDSASQPAHYGPLHRRPPPSFS